VKNLLIGDGSLNITCATGDPTLTIMAIAMRNAMHFAEEVRKRNL
jgi:choline dehydrogenase-like flavoprotein